MRVLLPPEQIKIQLIEVTNKPKATLAESYVELPNEPQPAKKSVEAEDPREKVTNHTKATCNKGMKVDYDKPKKVKRSHAAEPYTEPQSEHKKYVKTKDLDKKLEYLPILPEQVKITNKKTSYLRRFATI